MKKYLNQTQKTDIGIKILGYELEPRPKPGT